MPVVGGRFLPAQLVDEIVVREDHDPDRGIRSHRGIGGLAEGRHVPPLRVTGDHEQATNARSGQLPEHALRVGLELAEGEGDGSREPPSSRSRTVRQGGRDERVEARRKFPRGRFGLDLVAPQRKVGTVRFERADGKDHEGVRPETPLERTGIEVDQAMGRAHTETTEAAYLTRAER